MKLEITVTLVKHLDLAESWQLLMILSGVNTTIPWDFPPHSKNVPSPRV